MTLDFPGSLGLRDFLSPWCTLFCLHCCNFLCLLHSDMFHSKEKMLLISSGSPPAIWALISLGSAGLEPGLSGGEPCSLSGDCFPIVDNRDACLSGCGAQMRSAMKGLCKLSVILIGLQVQRTWLKHNPPGISLVVKWLTLSAPTAGITSSIPGRGTRSYMPCSMPSPRQKSHPVGPATSLLFFLTMMDSYSQVSLPLITCPAQAWLRWQH